MRLPLCASLLLALAATACGKGSTAGGDDAVQPDGSVTMPQCSDGVDNDGDGKIDYPADPGCFSALQNDEIDGCPGSECPQCGNGVDDDGDGKTDYPHDDGCTAASDMQEALPDPAACLDVPHEVLPDGGAVTSSLIGAASSVTSSPACGGAGLETAYEVYVPTASVLVATTDFGTTAIDTVLYVRGSCSDTSTELACNDDVNGTDRDSSVTAVIDTPGYYYVIVDGKTAGDLGAFQLQVTLFPGPGNACDPNDPGACAPGLVCRTVDGDPGPTCQPPVCHDGVDEDGDHLTDFPFDPGCTSVDDADESDSCPDGTSCPECGNGVDDDGDGAADYPEDTGCASASSSHEGCAEEQDPIVTVTGPHTGGDTAGKHDDYTPPSDCTGSDGGPDLLYQFTAPVAIQSLSFDTLDASLDSVVYVLDADCSGDALVCNDDSGDYFGSYVSLQDVAPGTTYAVVVDSYGTDGDTFTLNVHGTVAPGAACTDPLFAAGVLSCPTDTPCDGATCRLPACSDGQNNDADTRTDYPNDPGCASPTDDDETDTCPGAGCPRCGNGLDDDGDQLVDFPADPNCVSASDDVEGCEADATLPIATAASTGTTIGATGDFTASCGFLSEQAPDRTYLLTLPVTVTTLTIDTFGSGFDTVLSLHTPACDGNEIDCNDNDTGTDARLVETAVAPGSYVIVVDGISGSAGAYNLNVHGVVAAGAACTDPLFAAGVLACPAGHACNGTVCN